MPEWAEKKPLPQLLGSKPRPILVRLNGAPRPALPTGWIERKLCLESDLATAIGQMRSLINTLAIDPDADRTRITVAADGKWACWAALVCADEPRVRHLILTGVTDDFPVRRLDALGRGPSLGKQQPLSMEEVLALRAPFPLTIQGKRFSADAWSRLISVFQNAYFAERHLAVYAAGLDDIDDASEDPVGLALMEKYHQFFLEVAQRALAAADGMIDVLWIGDDYGTQTGPLMRAEIWDRLFRPRLRALIGLGHSYGAQGHAAFVRLEPHTDSFVDRHGARQPRHFPQGVLFPCFGGSVRFVSHGVVGPACWKIAAAKTFPLLLLL